MSFQWWGGLVLMGIGLGLFAHGCWRAYLSPSRRWDQPQDDDL